jgi:hypothetical protein
VDVERVVNNAAQQGYDEAQLAWGPEVLQGKVPEPSVHWDGFMDDFRKEANQRDGGRPTKVHREAVGSQAHAGVFMAALQQSQGDLRSSWSIAELFDAFGRA